VVYILSPPDRYPHPEFTEFRGAYLNQSPPGTRAVPFARGFFGKNIYASVAFSNDGNEAFWSSNSQIYQSKRVGGIWTKPEPLTIDSRKGTCPSFSPDGQKLYFVTWDDRGARICYAEKTAAGWAKTRELPEVINSTPKIHWDVSVDRKGDLYFASGSTNTDVKILYAEYQNGEYAKPRLIENIKNDATICPYVAPDGSYLIYVKTIPAEHDKAFYMMFKNQAGQWGREINISDIIGGKGFSPRVSPDGRYFFFMDGGIMYWSDGKFIADLKTKEFK